MVRILRSLQRRVVQVSISGIPALLERLSLERFLDRLRATQLFAMKKVAMLTVGHLHLERGERVI